MVSKQAITSSYLFSLSRQTTIDDRNSCPSRFHVGVKNLIGNAIALQYDPLCNRNKSDAMLNKSGHLPCSIPFSKSPEWLMHFSPSLAWEDSIIVLGAHITVMAVLNQRNPKKINNLRIR
jgi:hypothetical protein